MAFTTPEQRFSIMAFGGPMALRSLPVPAGAFGVIERFHMMAVYATAAPAPPVPPASSPRLWIIT